MVAENCIWVKTCISGQKAISKHEGGYELIPLDQRTRYHGATSKDRQEMQKLQHTAGPLKTGMPNVGVK